MKLRLALHLQYILCLVIVTATNEGLIIQRDNSSFLDHGGREITNLSGPKASNRKRIRGAISRVSDEEVDSIDVNPRIVGGQTAEKGAYPYMAVALYQERYFTCGGALVARNVVLLAAHCASRVDGILIGRQNLGRYDPREEYFTVVERAIHHDFKFLRPPTNDFMLVKLDGNSTYSPVAIDFDGISQDIASKEVAMVGWGQTGSTSGSRTLDLQVGFLDLLSNQQCASEWWGNFIGRDMICAYREGVSGCIGDSGGPLIYHQDNGQPLLIGSISWGSRGCNKATVCTNISYQAKWITYRINKWSNGELCHNYPSEYLCQQDTMCFWNSNDSTGCHSV